MAMKLKLMPRAERDLHELEFGTKTKDLAKLKRGRKCLALLEMNPRHPGLECHEFKSLKGSNGEKVWEAYVENRTTAAWRVFWHYGPGEDVITVVAITAHP